MNEVVVGSKVAQGPLSGPAAFLRFWRQDARVVLGSVNDPLNLNPVCRGKIENQLLFEMADSPHSQRREFFGFTWSSEVGRLPQFLEGDAGGSQIALRHIDTAILAEPGEMPDQITSSRRPYDRTGHALLRFLPGAHQRKPGTLDFGPVAVRHFRGFSAGFRFLHARVDALLPMFVHRNRPPFTLPKVQKELGRFLKELFAAGKFPALNRFVDALLKIGRQCNIHGASLRKRILRQESADCSLELIGAVVSFQFSVGEHKFLVISHKFSVPEEADSRCALQRGVDGCSRVTAQRQLFTADGQLLTDD